MGGEGTSNKNPTVEKQIGGIPPIINLKPFKMAFNFKIYQREDRVSLGTLATVCGVGGSYRPCSTKNLADHSKRLVLTMIKADGTSDLVTCSGELSKRLRNKEIALSQIANFPIVEQLTEDGDIMNCVQLPAGTTQLPSVTVTEEMPDYQPVSTFNPEELIAF